LLMSLCWPFRVSSCSRKKVIRWVWVRVAYWDKKSQCHVIISKKVEWI
jgi:hypothetical protein